MQEFAEKLRIFKWNADYVRERNAQLKEEEGEGAEVRLLPKVCRVLCKVSRLHLSPLTPGPSAQRMMKLASMRLAEHVWLAVSATTKENCALRCSCACWQRVGLNLRSDRIRACDVKFGQRMDLDLYTRHSELEGTRPKNVGASMPDHLRSSTHDRLELQSGLNDVPATCGAPSQTPALQQPVTQDLAPQEAGGTRTHPLVALLCTGTVI